MKFNRIRCQLCNRNCKRVGLPYIRWLEPKDWQIIVDPKTVEEAAFVPQAVQLILCVKCSKLSIVYFIPNTDQFHHEVVVKPNLPHHDWYEWAWEGVSKEIQKNYLRARKFWGEGSSKFDNSLSACRLCLELIMKSLGKSRIEWKQKSSLFEKIRILYSQGVLSQTLMSVCDEIRKLCNPAVHGEVPALDLKGRRFYPFEPDATIALFNLEALISHIFIIPRLKSEHINKKEWKSTIAWIEKSSPAVVL